MATQTQTRSTQLKKSQANSRLKADSLVRRKDMEVGNHFILKLLEEGSYYDGGHNNGDPFVNGDLEINNEGYNNPAVLVRIGL